MEIAKTLSPNDLGETGAHQAGILLPKESSVIIDFFPKIDASKKNPRNKIQFIDADCRHWFFNMIYYNNKFFGGTRNEYRLTCMTPFFKFYGLKSGDEIIFSKQQENEMPVYFIAFSKDNSTREKPVEQIARLTLSKEWSIVTIKQRRGIR